MNGIANQGLDVEERGDGVPSLAKFINDDLPKKSYDEEEDQDESRDKFDENEYYSVNNFQTSNLQTLNYLTHDAVPLSVFYQNHDNMTRALRPTLEQLHTGVGLDENSKRSWDPSKEEERQATITIADKSTKQEFKFGWVNGVLVPTMLNIWGVVLFLRIPWIVGQSGVLEASAIVILSTLVTVLTSMSMSAICTNGEVKGGGAYYMISRVLGPKFGGSIGVIFALANAIAVGFYFVGLGEAVQSILNRFDVKMIDERNDVRIIAFICLVLTFIVTQVGLDWVIHTQNALLLLIVLGVINATIGAFYPSPGTDRKNLELHGVTGIQLDTLKLNLHSDYRDGNKFFDIFALFFNGVTGMTAGANLSGDLRDPSAAIPIGTFTAIFLTSFSYLLLCWVVAVAAIRDATGPIDTVPCSSLNNTFSNISCTNNTDISFKFGTIHDYNIMERISLWGPLILTGIIAATLSSALSSLVSAPKVFQAVCVDKIFPYIDIFGKEYGRNKEPRNGYILAALIGAAFIAIGDINSIAPINSNFFLMSFALINYSVFMAEISKSPSWRPSYKYYNSWLSFFSFVLCVVLMFLINWWSAVVAIVFVGILYVFVEYRKPKVNWGESGISFSYINAIRVVRHLEPIEDHVKIFRINLMCLSGKPSEHPSLVRIASNITRHFGLMICGEVKLVSDLHMPEGYEGPWLKSQKFKAFHSIVHNETLRGGVRNLLQNVGLGKLRPNTMLVGFMNKWQERSIDDVEEYFGIIDDAFTLNYGVIVFRKQNEDSTINGNEITVNCAPEVEATQDTGDVKKGKKHKLKILTKSPKGFIDIWWLNDDGGLTILVPHILSLTHQWKDYKIRVFTPASTEKIEANQIKMANLLKRFRIEFSSVIEFVGINKFPKEESIKWFKNYRGGEHLPSDGILDKKTLRQIRLGELLRKHSKNASLVVISLPIPKRSIVSPLLYMSWIETLTAGLKTVLLIRGNQESVLTVYS